jgi:hypothetical protein
MANVKISDMTPKAAALAVNDEFEIAEAGTTTKSVTGQNIVDGVIAAGVAALAAAQTFTVSQRGTITTDNDLSFDIGNTGTNNFKCTPTGTGTLTFTNHTCRAVRQHPAGQQRRSRDQSRGDDEG